MADGGQKDNLVVASKVGPGRSTILNHCLPLSMTIFAGCTDKIRQAKESLTVTRNGSRSKVPKNAKSA